MNPRRPRMLGWGFELSIAMRLTIIATLATVVAVLTAAWMSFRSSEDLLLRSEVESMENSMERQIERATAAIDLVQQDALFISQSDAVQGIIRARRAGGYDEQANLTEADWRARLASVFAVLIESKGYEQVRLIGLEDGGKEIVRVDASDIGGGKVIIRQQSELQRKGRRDYMKEAAQLSLGQVYVSDITLNRERGVIEQPWRPMQRFSTPIFASDAGQVQQLDKVSTIFVNAVELAGSIRYHDEVLTMSALSAAQSQDPQWERRYRDHVPLLEKALARALKVTGRDGQDAIEKVAESNQALIEMEERSFELNHQGRHAESVDLLRSKSYTTQKAVYKSGLNTFLDIIESERSVEVFGIIVINANAQILMSDLHDSSGDNLVITNNTGGILHHPDSDREWGFELGSGISYAEEYPHSWQAIQSGRRQVVWDTDDQQVHVVGQIALEDRSDGRFLGLALIVREGEVLADIAGLRTKTLFVSVGAILGACFLCAFGVRKLTKPIAVLTNQARRISAGEQDVTIARIGHGEVGHLATAFSNLVEQLQSRTEEATRSAREVRELAESLDRKVVERTEALTENEARTNAILSAAADAIITINTDGIVQNDSGSV